jgi:hypothetical protein
MDWTRRGAGDAGSWLARRSLRAILAVAAAVVLAAAGAGCGHGGSPGGIIAASGDGGCPTQGVGGDTLAPPCASPASASTGPNGITGPPAGSGPPPPPPVPSASLGIAPPVAPSSTPTTPPPSPPPQVTAVSPASGAGSGGDSVTITGSGFTGATEVDFGAARAVMTVDSDTEITATSPPGTGTVDVTVVTPGGISAAGPADQFSYAG